VNFRVEALAGLGVGAGESPESHMQGEVALAAVGAIGAALQQRPGNEVPEGLEELRQGLEFGNLAQRLL